MGRLIDVDLLAKYKYKFDIFEEVSSQTLFKEAWNCAIDAIIENAPTVDVESIITKHEDIGYEKGFRDGYAEALEKMDEVTFDKDTNVPIKDEKKGQIRAEEIIVEFPSPLTDREKKMIYGYKGEVVRCKDCKYFNPHTMECDGIGNWFGLEDEWSANEYCSKGERREDEAD